MTMGNGGKREKFFGQQSVGSIVKVEKERTEMKRGGGIIKWRSFSPLDFRRSPLKGIFFHVLQSPRFRRRRLSWSSVLSSPPAPLEKRRNPCHLHCLALPIPRGDEGTFGKWMIEKATDYLRTWADYLKLPSKMWDESRIGFLRRVFSFQRIFGLKVIV